MLSDTASLYAHYLSQYNKDASNTNSENKKQLFQQNVEWIDKRNAELASQAAYKVSLNQFADWTESELRNMFGLQLQDSKSYLQNEEKGDPNDNNNNNENSNDTDDNRQNNSPNNGEQGGLNWATSNNPHSMAVVPPARNQGQCGACWAFVSAGSAEASITIATGSQVALSVQQLIDCATEFNRGCDGGNPVYAYQYMIANGITTWDDYPYEDQQVPYIIIIMNCI